MQQHSPNFLSYPVISILASSIGFLGFSFTQYYLNSLFLSILGGLGFMIGSFMAINDFASYQFRAIPNPDGRDAALITGGTHGIGLEIAKLFARDGFNLIITARYAADLQRAGQILKAVNPKIRIFTIEADLVDDDSAKNLFRHVYEFSAQIRGANLRINHLVNNAGFCMRGDFLDLPLDEQLRMTSLNVMHPLKMTWYFGNAFKNEIQSKQDSSTFRIMNVASLSSLLYCPFTSVYCGTKAYTHYMSVSLNEEWKSGKIQGKITLTSLCPGYTAAPSLPSAGIQFSNVWKSLNWDFSDRPARAGYRAMMSGTSYVMVGYLNNLCYWASGTFLPVRWTAKIVKFLNADFDETIKMDQTLNEGLKVEKGSESEASRHVPSGGVFAKQSLSS